MGTPSKNEKEYPPERTHPEGMVAPEGSPYNILHQAPPGVGGREPSLLGPSRPTGESRGTRDGGESPLRPEGGLLSPGGLHTRQGLALAVRQPEGPRGFRGTKSPAHCTELGEGE